MRSVRNKILIVLGAVLVVYMGLEWTVERAIIMPSFESIQREIEVKEMDRCKSLLDNELNSIGRTARDWSAWDDTYAFAANGNLEYIKSNLSQSTFESNKLNVIYMVDPNGKVVWGGVFDPVSKQFTDLPELSQKAIYERPGLYRHRSMESRKSGIFVAGRCPILLCSSPIITSERKGPIRGSVIMGRFLDKRYIDELGSAFKLDFTVSSPSEVTSAVAATPQGYLIYGNDKKSVDVVSVEPDILGSSKIAIKVRVQTQIAAKGRDTAMFMYVSTAIAIAITMCLMYWLLRRTFVTRLAKLDKCIAAVTASGDLSIRADVGGRDELGRMGSSLNGMLERLGDTEKALVKSDERFRSAFFGAPFPIMIYTDDGTVLQINRKWAQVTGYMPEETPTLDAWAMKAYGSSESPKGSVEKLRRLKDGLSVIRTKGGKTVMWQFTSASLGTTTDGKRLIISMAIDITDRDAAQRQLSESESRFRCMSENIPAVIYTGKIDREGTILYISPQVKTYFGFAAEELLRTPMARKSLIHPDDYEGVLKDYYKACSERRTFSCDYKALSRDGNIIWVHEEAQVIETAEGPVAQGVIFDVSRSKVLELKVSEANARLTEADRQRTEFMMNVSHELRTPLTVFKNVISNAVAGIYGPLPAALRDAFGMCEESISHLSHTVSDLLNMSVTGEDDIKLNFSRLDLNAVCQQVVQSAMAAAGVKGVAIKCHTACQPVYVSGDKDRLGEAMSNLVANAIKFSPEATGRVDVHVKPRHDMVIIEVRDNGKGIEPGDMEKLFRRPDQPEKQAGSVEYENGLAISKEIVRLHKGKIWVESAHGLGATFSFSLPLADFMAVGEQQEEARQEQTA
jgi:PAS domain S-box-containing protein